MQKKTSSARFHVNPNTLVKKYTKSLNSAVESGRITQGEVRLVQAFISEIGAQRDITANRKYSIVTALLTMRDFMPSYEECTNEDVFTAVGRYRNEIEHAQSTQKLNITAFKQFLNWLIETEKNSSLKSSRIAKIKTNLSTDLKSEKDILTGDELGRIFRAMKNIKDRAFIEILYESGGRINEVALLTWEQIEFIANHAVITVQSKSDKQRKIPLYTSSVTLKQWMHQYPHGIESGKYVFYGRASDQYKNMSYNTAFRIVKDAAKEAGITKNVHPHMFRHTRITDLLREGIPEQTIKMVMWGSVTSDMLKVYAHLTPTDAVNDMNRRMGIDTGQKKNPLPDVATPMQCPQCASVNSKLHMYCGICGKPLYDEVRDEYDYWIKEIEDDPLYKENERNKDMLLAREHARGEIR